MSLMKFFSLCLFILSSFFAIAQWDPIPEQDRQYLQQEKDENGYGCTKWAGQQPARYCTKYCRPSQSNEGVYVRCRARFSFEPTDSGVGSTYYRYCLGVADTQEEAETEAKNICTYILKQKCKKAINPSVSPTHSALCDTSWFTEKLSFLSCKLGGVCFEVNYGYNSVIIRSSEW